MPDALDSNSASSSSQAVCELGVLPNLSMPQFSHWHNVDS